MDADDDLVFRNDGQESLRLKKDLGNIEVSGQVKATDYKYAASKTKYKAVSPMDFISGSNDYTVMLFGSLGASYMCLEGTTGTMAYAPIHLPNGAVVEEVTAYFYNNFSSIYVNLPQQYSTGASIANVINTVQNTSDRLRQILQYNTVL